jgi:hypothetical protein
MFDNSALLEVQSQIAQRFPIALGARLAEFY